MRSLSSVVWSEGMHLAPHHFQMQSRYFEDVAAFTVSSLFFEPYGLVGCELDGDALLNGTVSVVHARGMMPDGLPFHFPDEAPPEPLELRERFSPTQGHHLVLLQIPAYRPNGRNYAAQREQSGHDARSRPEVTRFRPDPVQIRDQMTGQDEQSVALGRKNFRLALDGDATEGLVSLPIARVRRDGAGRFIYDPEYVPACLQIGASGRLVEILRGIVERLEAQAEALRRGTVASDTGLVEHAATDVVRFWLSHTVHSNLSLLRHHLESRTAHPEQLFVELSRLAGALCTFSLDGDARSLPRYEHERLAACFDALDDHIGRHLELVLPTRCVPIPLQPAEPYFHTGSVPDPRSFGAAHWFLAVRPGRAGGPASPLADVPKLVKLCSAKFVRELVRRGVDGLTLEPVASPPASISPRVGTRYFDVATTGPCWTSIVETGAVAAYTPAALGDVELEILVVLEP